MLPSFWTQELHLGGGGAYFQKRYTYEYLFAVSFCNFESKHTQFLNNEFLPFYHTKLFQDIAENLHLSFFIPKESFRQCHFQCYFLLHAYILTLMKSSRDLPNCFWNSCLTWTISTSALVIMTLIRVLSSVPNPCRIQNLTFLRLTFLCRHYFI